MWTDILTAFALYLILEGIMPFVSPENFRRTVARIGMLGDGNSPTNGAHRYGQITADFDPGA